MRNNRYSDLSPPTPKLHIIFKKDYRNSIVDRFSMVFFVLLVNAHSQNFFEVFETFFELPVKSAVFRCYTECRKGVRIYEG